MEKLSAGSPAQASATGQDTEKAGSGWSQDVPQAAHLEISAEDGAAILTNFDDVALGKPDRRIADSGIELGADPSVVAVERGDEFAENE
ncbi:MAG: hypothetical protein KDE05_13815 [Parvularculaceae bacterium]|nr:hypothetical protein [Parvularculaceae bacterium]